MSRVDMYIEWLESYWGDNKGTPFRIEGREWQREYFRALDGFKPAPEDPTKLCGSCKSLLGVIHDYDTELTETRTEAHWTEFECRGLTLHPILVCLILGDRQSGKTFSSCAYSGTSQAHDSNERHLYIATGEEHTHELVRENYREPIERNKALAKVFAFRGNSISVPAMHSKFEYTSTVPRSVTGRGLTKIFIDEARDVEADVVMAMLPGLQSQHGVACGSCPYKETKKRDTSEPCPWCKKGRLKRWFGRISIMSAAGVKKLDPKKDWFFDFFKSYQEVGDPQVHVIELKSNKEANPDIAEEMKPALTRIFGRLEVFRAGLGAEFGGEVTEEGDKFFAATDIDQAVNPALKYNSEGLLDSCLAYLDTSRVSDLTNLLIIRDTTQERGDAGDKPFYFKELIRIDIWNPKLPKEWPNENFPQGLGTPEFVTGMDERYVSSHIDWVFDHFPDIKWLWIDTRWCPWAQRLVSGAKQTKRYGHRVEGFNGWGKERDIGWNELEAGFVPDGMGRRRTIIPPHKRLLEELKDAEEKFSKGRWQVRETNRRALHLELGESLAALHYMSFEYAKRYGYGPSLSDVNRNAIKDSKGGDKMRTFGARKFDGPSSLKGGPKGGGFKF